MADRIFPARQKTHHCLATDRTYPGHPYIPPPTPSIRLSRTQNTDFPPQWGEGGGLCWNVSVNISKRVLLLRRDRFEGEACGLFTVSVKLGHRRCTTSWLHGGGEGAPLQPLERCQIRWGEWNQSARFKSLPGVSIMGPVSARASFKIHPSSIHPPLCPLPPGQHHLDHRVPKFPRCEFENRSMNRSPPPPFSLFSFFRVTRIDRKRVC